MPKIKMSTKPPVIIQSIKKVMAELCGKDVKKDSTKAVKKPKKGK
jgi:hypothetical protein